MAGTAQVTVRRAAAGDAEALARVHIAAWQAAYAGLVPQEPHRFWTRTMARPGPGMVVLAELDGVTAGFCYFGPTRDAEDNAGRVAEIYALNVAPQHWRHGAGRALCEHAARDARARECDTIILWVLEGNRAARRFYEALGYAVDGAERVNVKLMPGTPLAEVRYRKAIA